MKRLRLALTTALLALSFLPPAAAEDGPITLGGREGVRALHVNLYRGFVRVRADANARAIRVVPALVRWEDWSPGSDPKSQLRSMPAGALVTELRGDTARIAAPTVRHLVVLDIVMPVSAGLRIDINHYGDVEIAGGLGVVEVEQFQGAIAIRDVRGPVIAHIVRDGDIWMRLAERPASRPMALSTYEGDITLEIPEAIGPRLKITTVEGEVRNELAPVKEAGTVTEPRIVVRNAKGMIHVRALR